MPTLIEQKEKLLTEAHSVLDKAAAEGRESTADELAQASALADQIDGLNARIESAKRAEAIFARMNSGDPNTAEPTPGRSGIAERRFLGLTSEARYDTASKLASGMLTKGIAAPGSVLTDVPVTGLFPQGRIANSILELLPVVQHSTPTFRYLRQSSRTFAAAPVAPGVAKPKSTLAVTPIDGALQVIAHLVDGINEYDVLDAPSLTNWLADEMLYGLGRAVEQEVLLGDGSVGHLRGLLNTSGILTQAAVGTDKVATIRAAITAIQSGGYRAAAIVLSPSDWAAIELAKATTAGSYLLQPNLPIDSAAQRLFSVPVVLSHTMTALTAAVLDTAAVAVDTDSIGVRLQWSDSNASDWEKNLRSVRCEGRFGVSVFQPAGICKVTLPA